MYSPPHSAYHEPDQGKLTYTKYEWSFHPFADIVRMPAEKLKLWEGAGVEGVTYFSVRKKVILPDDQGEFVLRHEDRHCKLPDMLERENHAWDMYEQKH